MQNTHAARSQTHRCTERDRKETDRDKNNYGFFDGPPGFIPVVPMAGPIIHTAVSMRASGGRPLTCDGSMHGLLCSHSFMCVLICPVLAVLIQNNHSITTMHFLILQTGTSGLNSLYTESEQAAAL